MGKEAAPKNRRCVGVQFGEDAARAEQGPDRVVAEERREQHAHRRQVCHVLHGRSGHPVGGEPNEQRPREACGGADDHEAEIDPDREHHPRVLEGRHHPRALAPLVGGQAVHDPGPVRRGERAHGGAVQEQQRGEPHVGEVDREQLQEPEGERGGHHPTRRERPGAVTVGEDARDRPGDEEADGERQHVDPGLQGGLCEAVAVLGEPDPLQPDYEDEHQPSPPERGRAGWRCCRR